MPNSEIRSQINSALLDQWQKLWTESSLAKDTKFLFPCRNKPLSQKIYYLFRQSAGCIIKLITGHNNLMTHRHCIHPDLDAICSLCHLSEETFIHFLKDCPVFHSYRRMNLLFNTFSDSWSPGTLLHFSRLPRINSLLTEHLPLSQPVNLASLPLSPQTPSPNSSLSDISLLPDPDKSTDNTCSSYDTLSHTSSSISLDISTAHSTHPP